jgi:CheY-like chemotaxis protein
MAETERVPYQVLIVDDDPSTRYVYFQVLDFLNLTLESAASGDAALHILGEHAPALVVLDMLLPGVSGLDILAYIYTQPHLAKTRVLIITAHQHYRNTQLREGDLLLFKPVSSHIMRESVLGMLQLPASL